MYVVSLIFLISIREISTRKQLLHDSCRMLQINWFSSEFDTKVNERTKEVQIFAVVLIKHAMMKC